MRAFDGVRRSSGRSLTSRSSGKYMPRSKSWSRASGAALSSPRLLMEREAFVIAPCTHTGHADEREIATG